MLSGRFVKYRMFRIRIPIKKDRHVSITGWFIFGGLVGWIASKICRRRPALEFYLPVLAPSVFFEASVIPPCSFNSCASN